MVVRGKFHCHISAFSQGHFNLRLLVELINDFKYNLKYCSKVMSFNSLFGTTVTGAWRSHMNFPGAQSQFGAELGPTCISLCPVFYSVTGQCSTPRSMKIY